MKLFVYEHCPYCTRPRVVLGYKNITCAIEYLLDDDIDGHMDKVGAKQVPILQKDDGLYMTESLAIVDYLDNFQAKPIFKPTSGRADIEAVFAEMADEYRTLVFSYSGFAKFGELRTQSARQHYINRYLSHINVASFEMAVDLREQHKSVVETRLQQLDKLIYSPEYISAGGLSMDDVVYFANLHRMSVVPNLNLPTKVAEYMQFQLSQNKCDLVYV